MKKLQAFGICPFELGDIVLDPDGIPSIVNDILALHSAKHQTISFLLQLDHRRKLVDANKVRMVRPNNGQF